MTAREAETFFRVDEYVTGEARERKVNRIAYAFGDDPELGPLVRALACVVGGHQKL